MANTSRQYRPISSPETATDDALSVRFLRDMADNYNNFCMYVGNHKVIAQPCVPEWQSHNATTDERVIVPFTWRNVPDGHTTFLWILKHYRFAGGNDITWRLYCSANFYTGPLNMDTNYLATGYSSASVTTSSNYHKRSTDASLTIVRGSIAAIDGIFHDCCFFTLTAENADVSSRAAITAIDLWPWDITTEVTLAL